MLLDDQSAINCTIDIGRAGFRCCLAAAGTWVNDVTCTFREQPALSGSSDNAMAQRLADWNRCLATEAAGNETLTDMLAAAGQVCFAAPGSTRYLRGAILGLLTGVGIVLALAAAALAYWTWLDWRSRPPKRDETAGFNAGSEDMEMESTALLTAVNSERGDEDWYKDRHRRRSGESGRA
ncbi:uncharacterized protein LOC62_04G006428 [Vanrija pseudolonga]|uniref:Uncharacterized protein n=1 Tax=Vanrija pseudolonga TaxID=143232 RepID=A0AAF1BS43_9TREE|nr:hypothetical protein LOC62_04G006428 [Vanrija pseudolonga]